jgi:hypothetical protein
MQEVRFYFFITQGTSFPIEERVRDCARGGLRALEGGTWWRGNRPRKMEMKKRGNEKGFEGAGKRCGMWLRSRRPEVETAFDCLFLGRKRLGMSRERVDAGLGESRQSGTRDSSFKIFHL